jgi:hypothetical protein
MNRSLKLAVTVLVAGIIGCARAHITPTYGQSSSAAFARQSPTKAKITGPVSGLDSQEAAIISASYLRSLAPKTVQPKEEPIRLVAPPGQGGGYGMTKLAPSVPIEK